MHYLGREWDIIFGFSSVVYPSSNCGGYLINCDVSTADAIATGEVNCHILCHSQGFRRRSARGTIAQRNDRFFSFFYLIWFGLVWFVWFGLVWFGLVWFGLVWFGLVWFGLVWLGWVGLGWVGLGWIGLDWIGLDWIGLDWIGLDWIGLDWIGLD